MFCQCNGERFNGFAAREGDVVIVLHLFQGIDSSWLLQVVLLFLSWDKNKLQYPFSCSAFPTVGHNLREL